MPFGTKTRPGSPRRLLRFTRASNRSIRFRDGHGRAGRLVPNLLLVRLGIPPAIIDKGARSRYLDV